MWPEKRSGKPDNVLHPHWNAPKQSRARVRDKAVRTAQAADEAVHEHPYKAIAIGAGVGAFIGFIVARRCSRNGD
jgi:ElaB/YqjD/DUF883 family membrane-anchored ribosome-binding protein